MKQSQFLKILKLTKTILEEEQNWGEDEIIKNKTYEANLKKKEPNIVSEPPAKAYQANVKSNQSQELEALKEQLKNCKECPLGESRLNCVFGEGSPEAEIMFVGEGPGFDEDHQGRPFIGRAGQLLTKIIEAMGYAREKVYIANIVKCHPMKDPSNPESRGNDRPPTPEESGICKRYLDMQIDIIKPKVIVTLGAPSSKGLLNSEESISNLRGNFRDYKGIKLMPTYHPAALLRNPSLKRNVWDDMKKVMEFLKQKND
ncbi:MAG: uracil-DNA glycosylase [Elusimicrobiota bacterium]|jgi:DNA polymerase|nr:uracil-DNA glycosylase [Elusimicrobiota bacterium]